MVRKQIATLCDKEFELGRDNSYANLDREIADIREHFASRGLLKSSAMAQAVVDAVMARFEKVIDAFNDAYLGKWRASGRHLSDAEYEWLKGKAESVLEEEARQVGATCNGKLWDDTLSFVQYWQQAEIEARAKKVDFFKRIEILRLQKGQGYTPEVHEAVDAEPREIPAPNWDLLHSTVVKAARSRFESGHLADSVEAALRELNDVVKKIVYDRVKEEYDGASLMNHAFSLNKPIVSLADLSTQTGRDIQVGYMQIFAGAMTGIRNPKAHANIEIDAKRAVHFLFLASLLFFKIEEAMSGSDVERNS